jgi:CheY-like chemotaxis protein
MLARRSTVLLIDDVRETRQALAELLQRRGYTTLEAGGGEEGLRMLRDHAGAVGVVALDLLMPGSNGWWFREQQLVDAAVAEIPVVVFTSAGKSDLLKYTLKVQDVLFKPVSVDDLLEAIARYVQPQA